MEATATVLSDLTPAERLLYYEREIRRPDLYPDHRMDAATSHLAYHFGGSFRFVSRSIESSHDWDTLLHQADSVLSAIRSQMHEGWIADHNQSGESYWQGEDRWHQTVRGLWKSGEAEGRIEVAREHVFDLMHAVYAVGWPLDWCRLPDADEARIALSRTSDWTETKREELYTLTVRTRHKDMWMIEERWFYMELAIETARDIVHRWSWLAGHLAYRLVKKSEETERAAPTE